VNLRNSDLTEANFTGANLNGADFTGAALDGAIFNGAVLDGAIFESNRGIIDTCLCYQPNSPCFPMIGR